MKWFRRWANREYGAKLRLTAIILGGFCFWIVIPFLLVIGAGFIDLWLRLPQFDFGVINVALGLLFIVPGWLFANWTIRMQYSLGKGTPIPIMATQKLVVKRPYTYCRNPMNLGTTFYYLGVAIWMGSLSAVGLALIYPIGMLAFVKLFEEKELEERFGAEYLDYKDKTPFLIPRFRKQKEGGERVGEDRERS